jgi:hypothetical protein
VFVTAKPLCIHLLTCLPVEYCAISSRLPSVGTDFALSSADWQVRGKAETLLSGIGFAFRILVLPLRALEAVNVQPYLASHLCNVTVGCAREAAGQVEDDAQGKLADGK